MGMDVGGMFNDPFFQGGGLQMPRQQQQPPRQRQINPPQLVEIEDEEEENEFAMAGGQPIVEEPDEDYNQNQQQQFNGNHYMNGNNAVGHFNPNPNRGNRGFNSMFMNPGMGQGSGFQSYSYSSYSSNGPGGVSYQETSQTNMGPGGVMESRRSVRDGRTGKEQVEVTRGLQNRGRTVQRTRFGDGREEAVDTLHNLTPETANQFDGEWQQAANRHLGNNRLGSSRGSQRQQFRQIGDGSDPYPRRI
eukprot:TRINITY_DN46062_c0_g1_i4.p2 TRINITY_DN46062_c0_g1~~TRINITY_DN46062_c0_g1_i4.p2  ORF type:complete len:247 (-),score=46.01 TRINITY_DN46062_c0_g1_i4:241-981(-)